MLNLRFFDFRIWATIFISCFFGLAFFSLALILNKPIILLMFPLVEIFFIFLIIKPRETFAFILLIRPSIDLLLDRSKVEAFGTQFSLGAGFNLSVVFLIIFFLFRQNYIPKKNTICFLWFMNLFIMFLSISYSPFKGSAIRLFIDQLSYFAMFLIPYYVVKNHKDFLFFLKIVLFSFIVPLIWGDLDLFVFGGRYFPDSGQRIAGLFAHPNILAFYSILGITVYYYVFIGKFFKLSQFKKNFFILIILNMLVLLIASKTRNAWLAFFVLVFVYGYLKDKKILFWFLLLSCLSFFVPTIQQRIMNVFTNESISNYHGVNSFEWRIQMWKSALPMIAKKPIQGYGLTSFKPMSEQFSSVGTNGAHNAYLEILYETGIFGLIFILLLFVNLLYIFYKNMINTRDVLNSKLWGLLVGYFISYMIIFFGDNLAYYLAFNWYVWFFFGLIFSNERNVLLNERYNFS